MAMKTIAEAKHSTAAWRGSRRTIAVTFWTRLEASGSAGIVRAFAGNRDVMGVAFTKSGVGYAYKGGAFPEVGKIARTDITHSGFQAARKLVKHTRHRSFVWNLPFDAFRDEFRMLQ